MDNRETISIHLNNITDIIINNINNNIDKKINESVALLDTKVSTLEGLVHSFNDKLDFCLESLANVQNEGSNEIINNLTKDVNELKTELENYQKVSIVKTIYCYIFFRSDLFLKTNN